MTSILEDNNIIELKQRPGPMIKIIPLMSIFDLMGTRIKTEVCGDMHIVVAFIYTDIEEAYRMEMRHGILETIQIDYQSALEADFDIRAKMTNDAWRRLVAQQLNPVWAYLSGAIKIEPNVMQFKYFFDCFEKDA